MFSQSQVPQQSGGLFGNTSAFGAAKPLFGTATTTAASNMFGGLSTVNTGTSLFGQNTNKVNVLLEMISLDTQRDISTFNIFVHKLLQT